MASFGVRGRRLLHKAREWGVRYLPAEVAGTVCSVVGAYLAFHALTDRAVAALAGTMAENLGFYAVMAAVEWRRQAAGPPAGRGRAARTAAALFAEFGVAEAFDSLVVRPLCLYLGPFLTGGIATGSALGKVMADVIFYVAAIAGYELVQRRAAAARRRAATVADHRPAIAGVRRTVAGPGTDVPGRACAAATTSSTPGPRPGAVLASARPGPAAGRGGGAGPG